MSRLSHCYQMEEHGGPQSALLLSDEDGCSRAGRCERTTERARIAASGRSFRQTRQVQVAHRKNVE